VTCFGGYPEGHHEKWNIGDWDISIVVVNARDSQELRRQNDNNLINLRIKCTGVNRITHLHMRSCDYFRIIREMKSFVVYPNIAKAHKSTRRSASYIQLQFSQHISLRSALTLTSHHVHVAVFRCIFPPKFHVDFLSPRLSTYTPTLTEFSSLLQYIYMFTSRCY